MNYIKQLLIGTQKNFFVCNFMKFLKEISKIKTI